MSHGLINYKNYNLFTGTSIYNYAIYHANIIYKIQIVVQMIWYFNEATSFCLLMYQLLGEHKIIWTFNNIILYSIMCFIFVLENILFLTLNYVCETVYDKVYIYSYSRLKALIIIYN